MSRSLNGQDIKPHVATEPPTELDIESAGDDGVMCTITVGGEEADWERLEREYHERGGDPDSDGKPGPV